MLNARAEWAGSGAALFLDAQAGAVGEVADQTAGERSLADLGRGSADHQDRRGGVLGGWGAAELGDVDRAGRAGEQAERFHDRRCLRSGGAVSRR